MGFVIDMQVLVELCLKMLKSSALVTHFFKEACRIVMSILFGA
jgi:hypothetical protein